MGDDRKGGGGGSENSGLKRRMREKERLKLGQQGQKQ